MTQNIQSILNGQADRIDFDFCLEIDSEDCPPDVKITEPVRVTGKITNQAGYMKLSLTADISAVAQCSRCLDDVDASFKVSFEKDVALKGKLENPDNDDYLIVDGDELDIETPLTEQILIDIPTKFLCKEDCKGLCSKCGKNLNEGDCGCSHKEIDPRFEVLRKLLEENK